MNHNDSFYVQKSYTQKMLSQSVCLLFACSTRYDSAWANKMVIDRSPIYWKFEFVWFPSIKCDVVFWCFVTSKYFNRINLEGNSQQNFSHTIIRGVSSVDFKIIIDTIFYVTQTCHLFHIDMNRHIKMVMLCHILGVEFIFPSLSFVGHFLE